jgi:2-amino-4-hydroxy-6-hydroxymethyldihydropteridine diphosphokinase
VTRAVFAVGSNLGDRLGYLRLAVREAARTPGLDVVAVSPVYETAPVGGPPQDDYLNAVFVVETALHPRVLLALAHEWEQQAGRVRVERWGPRTLDVDLIAVGDVVLDEPADGSPPRSALTLPHPRAHERAFVLLPWLDADRAAEIPDHGRVAGLVAALAEAADTSGVRRRDDLDLVGPAR